MCMLLETLHGRCYVQKGRSLSHNSLINTNNRRILPKLNCLKVMESSLQNGQWMMQWTAAGTVQPA